MSTTLDLAPTKDGYISSGSNADTSFSNAQLLAGTFAPIGQGHFYRMLLEFDLSALPPGALIVSATLTLTRVGGTTVATPTYYCRLLTRNSWTSAMTWNRYDGTNAWTTVGGDHTTDDQDTVVYGGSGNLVFDGLANMVLRARDSGQDVIGVEIIGPESLGTSNYFAAHSLTGATPGELTIEYEATGLAVTDNGDATGAEATISGTDSGDTTIVYSQRINDDLSDGTWRFAGSRVGDGTLELDLDPGHYFVMAKTVTDNGYATSPVIHLVVTDGEDAYLTAILEAAKARIELLALSGLASVVIQKELNERLIGAGKEFALPACILAPMNWASPANAGTNEQDDCTYSIACVFFSADNQVTGVDAKDERQFLWLQKTAWAFRQQRLPGVPTIIRTEVQPGEITVDEAWKDGWHASALLLKFISREGRGLT